MNQTEVTTIDDLPELPFKLLLSYLSLEDLANARAVSRGWYHRINSFRVKTLCCSEVPRWMIKRRSQLVSGAFAQYFIGSSRFSSFFTTFTSTILANLKHLRLYDLNIRPENMPQSARILSSFGHLEELDIIEFSCLGLTPLGPTSIPKIDFELNLPMLTSIRIEVVDGIGRLTLDSPRLQKIKLYDCLSLRLELVHSESVKRFITSNLRYHPVTNLKNLQTLHIVGGTKIDSTFLSSLEQLREICLESPASIRKLFEQKQRYGRTNLKIYRFGCLLNGPEDPLMSSARFPDFDEAFAHLAANPTRLADELPPHGEICYEVIKPVAADTAANLLNRFTDLDMIEVNEPIPVRDVQHFLDLLKNSRNIVELAIYDDQPQNLFDQLPEHCAVESLNIESAPSDLAFLFRLKSLNTLVLRSSVNIEVIRKAFEELPLLLVFEFDYLNNEVRMEIDSSKRFNVSAGEKFNSKAADLNTAIEFIVENLMEIERRDEDVDFDELLDEEDLDEEDLDEDMDFDEELLDEEEFD